MSEQLLPLDPLEVARLAAKSAVDRAVIYGAANLGYLERVAVEVEVRREIVRGLDAEAGRKP